MNRLPAGLSHERPLDRPSESAMWGDSAVRLETPAGPVALAQSSTFDPLPLGSV